MGQVLAFFTDEQAASLAGLSVRQVRYWRDTDVFKPEYVADDGDARPLHSFRDVVALRTLGLLRKHVPLQELRKVSDWLHARYEQPWSSLRFFVVGREVIFEEPRTGNRYTVRPRGQKLIEFAMKRIVHDVEGDVRKLFERRDGDVGKITARGLIEGTRIPAATIRGFANEGYSVPQILKEYPTLRRADIEAAIAYEPPRARTQKRTA